MILKRDIPAAFIASNSRFSPMFPKVIREDNNIAKGSAETKRDNVAYNRNSKSTEISNPFPIILSTEFQRNIIRTMNRQTTKVAMNVPR